jgi:hypothetical protein
MTHQNPEERRKYLYEYNHRPEVREKNTERVHARNRKWRSNGLCSRCGGENLPEYKTCESCRIKANNAKKIRINKMRSLGLCCRCGKPVTSTGYVNCDACRAYIRKWQNAKLKKLYPTPEHKYSRYIKAAKRDNRTFDLTFEQFVEIGANPCYICGTPPNGELNGLDRVNNAEGYTSDNIRSCCSNCNYMKRNHSLDGFLEHIKKITEYNEVKQW